MVAARLLQTNEEHWTFQSTNAKGGWGCGAEQGEEEGGGGGGGRGGGGGGGEGRGGGGEGEGGIERLDRETTCMSSVQDIC